MPQEGLQQILEKIFKERGFDFRQYKESTLRRRIERRLKTTKAVTYQDYLAVLDADPTEYKKLLDDLTIKVTEFFRDPEAWETLGKIPLPELVTPSPLVGEGWGEGGLRVWSAGCATGEEAYSVAMLLLDVIARSPVRPACPPTLLWREPVEGRGTTKQSPDLQFTIYATDIDNDALLKAQEGRYNPISAKGVPKDILDKYFDSTGNLFVVKNEIRKSIHFKPHDLVLDEPLKEMDFILCRNVVIYFERPLQEKVFMDFYNSLNEGGHLFLGKAETLIGPARERFKVIDKRWKIYQKKEDFKRGYLNL